MAVGTGYTITNQWTNADGLTVAYSSQGWPTNIVRPTPEEATKFAVLDVDLTKLATGQTSYPRDLSGDQVTDGFSEEDFYFPVGSSVLRVIAVATTAAAGGTSITLGTYQKDGTIVSATSLITATEGVLANMSTKGARIYGAGAYLTTTAGTVGPGSSSGVNEYVALTATGTFTAGKLRIFIEYLDGSVEV